jgi:hypothetical protein
MIENKQQRPTLIATKNSLLFAHKSAKSRATPRLSPQLLHRVIHTIHNAPVDITVDNEAPFNGEKPQQNQHFKYHRPVRYSYRDVNKPLATLWKPEPAPPRRAPPIVTLLWNMHRFGAACSLNVTSVGICPSKQQYVFSAMWHCSSRNVRLSLTRPNRGTIVKRTFGMLAAHEPRVFPGTS